jgi:hypothetical protein
LQPLGISATANDPLLELPAAAQQRASSVIADQIRHQSFAIFHPGSARVEKFWEPERWAAIIEFAANELGLFPVYRAAAPSSSARTLLLSEKNCTPLCSIFPGNSIFSASRP